MSLWSSTCLVSTSLLIVKTFLTLLMLLIDQIKHVIEMGDAFTRHHFMKLMDTFDEVDINKDEVKM